MTTLFLVRFSSLLLFNIYCVGRADNQGCVDSSFDCANKDALRQICNSTLTQTFCRKSCGLCKVEGHWSNWTASGHCSVTCGQGIQKYHRTCANLVPTNSSANCTGKEEKTEVCSMSNCPVNGGWNEWQPWSTCSATCNTGRKIRHRLCDKPPPEKGGRHCVGSKVDKQYCAQKPCPVDGQWSKWGHWGRCSATCGGGRMSRVRSCDHPLPAHSGNPCVGLSVETLPCSWNHCKTCRFRWIPLNNHCYLINKSDQLTWHEARNYCRTLNANLVEINGKAESDFLVSYVNKIGGNYWIGATDKDNENHFRWVTTGQRLSNTYSPWCPHEPDAGNNHVKDCVLLKEHCNHKWSDDQCSSRRHFICEMAV